MAIKRRERERELSGGGWPALEMALGMWAEVEENADRGKTVPWHRHGNHLINCTEISLMNSSVVISLGSSNRMSFSFLMGQHSCSFGKLPVL